ncbi:right-handed parallel beta-helix repeat-containing protein [Novosphingobium aerophilum]|uniref:Right-handed parallel beta-helix repeat-containing protein n=1 Tax=Novosphingobium aerophilum TaxID=2839843 RepID=A0A7X1F9F8_9SPHN|nr:right-handed parallel beta-helix repeat-containing protein [Novosphingobium aerophilum]MBC2652841.1 right-handed parallel beta-helix repeat-containing protein [Novosphingobium aerophilum]
MTTLTFPRPLMRILSAAALGLASLLGLSHCSPAISDSGTIDALTDDDVARAIARSDGGTIRIGSGAYSAITIRSYSGQRPLIIESIRADDPARLAGLTIAGSRNVIVRNVVIQPSRLSSEAAATKGADALAAVNVRGSSDVTIEGVTLTGTPQAGAIGNGTGMLVRKSRSIRVIACQFSHFRYGLAFLSGDSLQIERNEFHDLRTDAIRGGGVSNLLIQGNVISNLKPDAGDHPDGVQLWTANETQAARAITIRANLIFRGNGGIIQGIFVRDNKLQLPFEDLEISGNLIVGSMYHGISVQGGRRLRIIANEVISVGGQKTWIRLSSVDHATVIDNRASTFLFTDSRQIEERGNKIRSPSSKETRTRMALWLQQHRELTDRPGKLLKSIMQDLDLQDPQRD